MVDLVIDDRDDDDNDDDDDGGRDGGRDGCKVVYDAGLKMVEWLIVVVWIGCFDDGKSWASFIWSVKLQLLIDDDDDDDDAAANCVGERVSNE